MDLYMPCQPYFIRHIKTNDDLLSYAKMYFTFCEKKGLSVEDALLLYKATVTSMLPKDRPQLFLYHNEILPDEDFVLAIKTDTDLPPAPACHKYCRNVLGSTDLCKTCQYYSGYTNRSFDLQCSLLKFILTSHDNYLSVEEELGLPKKVFKGYSDLLKNLNEPDPLPVPMLLYIYKAIQKYKGKLYSSGSVSTRLELLKEPAVKLLAGASRAGKYDAVLSIPAARFEKIWQIVCSDIINAEDMSVSEAEAFLSGACGKVPEASVPEQEPVLDFGNVVFGAVSDYFETPTTADENARAVEEPEPQGSSSQEETGTAESGSGNNPPDGEGGDVPTADDSSMDAGSGNEAGTEPVCPGSNVDTSQAAVEDTPVTVSAEKTEDGPGKKAGMEKNKKVSKNDPLYVAPCSTLSFAEPEGMDTDYVLSNFAPVEIFKDSGGALCFVFLLRDNFYVCRPESPKVKELLSNKKLLKICWQPFDILSLCVKNGVSVKSLHSIMETEMTYFYGSTCASFWDVCSKYVRGLPTCSYEQQRGIAMKYYRRIFSNQTEAIKKFAPSDEIHSCFEILGRSYHRDRSIKNGGRLFGMSCDGKIGFSEKCKFTVVSPGYEVNVFVENLQNTSVTESFISMLGRFRTVKFNRLQVVAINDNLMTLYVPAAMYEFVSSYIHVFFDKLAFRTGNMDMKVNYMSKYYDPSLPLRYRNRPPENPRSLLSLLENSTPKKSSAKIAPVLQRVSLRSLFSSSGETSVRR